MPRRPPPPRPKGTPKTGGRQKGTPNKTTVEGRAFARAIVDDPEYRAALKVRMVAGLAGPMESLCWQYAYGKPKDEDQGSIAGILAQLVAGSSGGGEE